MYYTLSFGISPKGLEDLSFFEKHKVLYFQGTVTDSLYNSVTNNPPRKIDIPDYEGGACFYTSSIKFSNNKDDIGYIEDWNDFDISSLLDR